MITSTARFWLITLVVTGILMYLLAPVLTPFVVAALLAYLADPIVDRVEHLRIRRWRLGRTGGVVLVFVAMSLILVALLVVLVPMLEKQIMRLVEQVPTYLLWLQEVAMPWLASRLGIETPSMDVDQLSEMLKENWQNAGGVASSVLAGLSRSGMAVVGWLINLFLIPVVTFYLLRDWDVLLERVRALLPRDVEPVVTHLARESDQVLGAFLRGQLLVMLALATMYAVGLSLLGLELALLIGVIAGLISFIPYLGAIVGFGMGIVASMFQVGELWHIVAVLAVFSLGQVIESVVLQPVLLGDRIGLHPVAVIFAVLAGGQLFGFLGVLLALPVAAVLMVVLRYLFDRYRASEVYAGQEPSAGQVLLPDDVAAGVDAGKHRRGRVSGASPTSGDAG